MLNCGIGEDSWKSLGLPGDPTCLSSRKSILNIHWKDWCWSLNSNPLAIWCKELTYWKRPWCWKILNVGGKGDDRGWDGWMASLTQRTWIFVSSRGDGPGGLVCYSPRGCKELNMTEWLNLYKCSWKITCLSSGSSPLNSGFFTWNENSLSQKEKMEILGELWINNYGYTSQHLTCFSD